MGSTAKAIQLVGWVEREAKPINHRHGMMGFERALPILRTVTAIIGSPILIEQS